MLKRLEQVHESEHDNTEEQSSYQQLSLAQKLAASELRQFGFELQLIRGEGVESFAVFTCDYHSITVDYWGEVDKMMPLYSNS